MTHEELTAKTEEFVMSTLGSDTTGHDWHHTDRVRERSLHIAGFEGGFYRMRLSYEMVELFFSLIFVKRFCRKPSIETAHLGFTDKTVWGDALTLFSFKFLHWDFDL